MPPLEVSPELESLVIRRLVETADRNKVVEELCMERRLHWSEAEEIVEHVIVAHRWDITRRQSPFLVPLSFIIFVSGVLLVAWNLVGVYNYFWPYLDPNTPDALGLYLLYSDAFQYMMYTPWAPPLFITGLAMMAGSYFGMKDVWSSVFDWFDQRQMKPARTTASEENPTPQSAPRYEDGSSREDEFVPSQEMLDYIFDHLDRGQNQAQIMEGLWLQFGIPKATGLGLLRRVLSTAGKDVSGKSMALALLAALGGILAGFIWVIQFVLVLINYLAGISRPLENSWDLILWLSEIAHYIERFPGLFGLFVLGLVFLVLGIYKMKDVWPLIFILKKKPFGKQIQG